MFSLTDTYALGQHKTLSEDQGHNMTHMAGVGRAEGLWDTLPSKALNTSMANGHWLLPSGHWVLPLVCQHMTV